MQYGYAIYLLLNFIMMYKLLRMENSFLPLSKIIFKLASEKGKRPRTSFVISQVMWGA